MYPGSLGEIRYPYAYFTVLTAGTRELMSSLAGTVQGYSTEYIEDDNKHHNIIYVLVLSLFSALESLLHEVNLVCDLGVKEWKVDDRLLQEIPPAFHNLKKLCLDISTQDDFLYLKDAN